jgi:hypothetical protein
MRPEHKATPPPRSVTIPAEFRDYCSESTTDEPILEYWKRNAKRFPVLASMARDYLAAPASSASSERLFSATGNFLTPKRSRLGPDALQALACLHSWHKTGVINTKYRDNTPDVQIIEK